MRESKNESVRWVCTSSVVFLSLVVATHESKRERERERSFTILGADAKEEKLPQSLLNFGVGPNSEKKIGSEFFSD